jgi:phosphatidate cytidylyltransferase
VVRIVSGAVLLVALVGLLLAGRLGISIVVVVVAVLALWEFRGLCGRMGLLPPAWLIYPLGVYFTFAGTLLEAVPVELVLSAALVLGLSAFLVLSDRHMMLGRWAMALAGAVYVGVPLDAYLLLYRSAPGQRAPLWVLVVILTVVVSDSSALLVGQRFGRHPFFPAISPRKTVEGALGGLGCCIPVMSLGGIYLLGLPAWHAVLLAVMVGIAAQTGDLVESQMKRLAGVKDSSNLIPGHGGVLDRLDSLLFPPIVVYLYASYLHLL